MQLAAVDFFCGAGGMSYGLARAGIKVLAGIDNDPSCKETYEHNNKPSQFLECDLAKLSPENLAEKLKIKRNDETLIFAGCSPCQFWSKIKTDKTKSQQSAFLLREFEKFISWFNPGFVVIENVPGLLTRTKESILPQFLEFLRLNSYTFQDGIINAVHYGVPQNRKRYLLVATRVVPRITLPKRYKNNRLIVENFIGLSNGFPSIDAGHIDTSKFIHTAAALSEQNLRRIKITPEDGGTRSSWRDDPDLQIEAYEARMIFFVMYMHVCIGKDPLRQSLLVLIVFRTADLDILKRTVQFR
jgi:DNA (cytosine-5)-methyltransferase 1